MRVIAGTFRSRILQTPRGTATRPTSDRLRETLFNVLSPRIAGARFADLYAGSGAVGIEALSRDAAHVYFAETSRPALESLRANLRTLGVAAATTVNAAGTAALLQQLTAPLGAQFAAPLDIVFLDPPYDQASEYVRTLTALGADDSVLSADALVVAEHARKSPLADVYGRLHRTRTLLQGDAALSFYAVQAAGAEREA